MDTDPPGCAPAAPTAAHAERLAPGRACAGARRSRSRSWSPSCASSSSPTSSRRPSSRCSRSAAGSASASAARSSSASASCSSHGRPAGAAGRDGRDVHRQLVVGARTCSCVLGSAAPASGAALPRGRQAHTKCSRMSATRARRDRPDHPGRHRGQAPRDPRHRRRGRARRPRERTTHRLIVAGGVAARASRSCSGGAGAARRAPSSRSAASDAARAAPPMRSSPRRQRCRPPGPPAGVVARYVSRFATYAMPRGMRSRSRGWLYAARRRRGRILHSYVGRTEEIVPHQAQAR